MSVSSNILEENSRDLLREEEPCEDKVELPINDDDEEFSITSIRIVLVDSDPKSLCLIKNLMTQFSYQVRDFRNGDEAIAFLKTSKHEIDLVIWDYHVPEISGLEALNTIAKELDLPVKETVMESTKRGSCNFIVKPVSKEVIAVLWQHVYRKSVSHSAESDPEEDGGLGQDNNDIYQSNKEESSSWEQNNSYQREEKSKKPRMTWTPELHQVFQKAVEKMGGLEQAVPKQILKCMQEEKEINVEGLTRNNVASHLQKYRLSNGKKSCVVPAETREDSDEWGNATARPNTNLTASIALPNSSFGLHTYFPNGQDARNAPMQHYPSTSYLTMNDMGPFMTNSSLANILPFTDLFHQQQQQQFQHHHYSHSSLELPSVITKQEPVAAMENPDLISNPHPFFDSSEFFPPGLGNFDTTNHH